MPNHLRSRDVWGFPHVRDHGLLARALSIVQFCAATPGGARRWVTVDARIFRRRSRYHDSFGSVCWCTDRRLTGAGGVFALLSNTMLPRQVARRSRNETSWSMPPSWGPRSFAQGCNDQRHRPPTRHRRWRHPDQLCQNQSGLAPDRWRCPGGLGALVPALASGCDLHARPAAGCSSPPQHRQALGETEGVPIDPAAQRERALANATDGCPPMANSILRPPYRPTAPNDRFLLPCSCHKRVARPRAGLHRWACGDARDLWQSDRT
jgi:hypothetical protein